MSEWWMDADVLICVTGSVNDGMCGQVGGGTMDS